MFVIFWFNWNFWTVCYISSDFLISPRAWNLLFFVKLWTFWCTNFHLRIWFVFTNLFWHVLSWSRNLIIFTNN